MAIKTADRGTVQPILNYLPDESGINGRAGVGVAEGAVGTVQGVDIVLRCQGPGAGRAEHGRVAGMALCTGTVDGPEVVRRRRHVA